MTKPPTEPCGACHDCAAAAGCGDHFDSCVCPCHSTSRVAPAAPLHSLRCDAEWSEYVTFHRDHGHGIGPRECIEGCPLWRPEAPAQPEPKQCTPDNSDWCGMCGRGWGWVDGKELAALRERLAAVEGALRSAHVRNCYCDIQGPDGSLSDANCAAMRRAALDGGLDK